MGKSNVRQAAIEYACHVTCFAAIFNGRYSDCKFNDNHFIAVDYFKSDFHFNIWNVLTVLFLLSEWYQRNVRLIEGNSSFSAKQLGILPMTKVETNSRNSNKMLLVFVICSFWGRQERALSYMLYILRERCRKKFIRFYCLHGSCEDYQFDYISHTFNFRSTKYEDAFTKCAINRKLGKGRRIDFHFLMKTQFKILHISVMITKIL